MFHPLHTDIKPPERFTYPFYYEPHPLCLLAAKEVQQHLQTMPLTEGKMFGVLVVTPLTSSLLPPTSNIGFLAAYSGLLCGRNDWPWFVPPVFDAQQPDGHFKVTERLIKDSPDHKQLSQQLQLWLFDQYRFLNAHGERKDLLHVWQDYHCSPRIRNRYPLPPGGTGDCCAPKLLQYAYNNGLKPLCMAEFWWGPSPRTCDESGLIRQHGQFYPACRGKCKPILTWMLQGLDVDPSPDENGFPHLQPKVVYEDDAIAVIDDKRGAACAEHEAGIARCARELGCARQLQMDGRARADGERVRAGGRGDGHRVERHRADDVVRHHDHVARTRHPVRAAVRGRQRARRQVVRRPRPVLRHLGERAERRHASSDHDLFHCLLLLLY